MEMIRWVQSFASPFWDRFFVLVTQLGDDHFFACLLIFSYWCIHKELAYRMGFSFYLNSLLNAVLKNIFRIPRSFGQIDIRTLNEVPIGGYSFPSGHVQSAVSYSTTMMRRYRYTAVYLAGAAVILLVAVSRLYLGAHTPVDVVGAIAAGVGGVILGEWIFGTLEKRDGRQEWKLLAMIAVILSGMLMMSNKGYYLAAGNIIGVLVIYYLDQRWLHFRQPVSYGVRIATAVVGYGIYVMLNRWIEPFYSGSPLGKFAEGMIHVTLVFLMIPLLYTVLNISVTKWVPGRSKSNGSSVS